MCIRDSGKGDITSEEYNSALLSFFARLNDDDKERYLVSASIRSDKSSKFAKGNRVGYFERAAAARQYWSFLIGFPVLIPNVRNKS